jgi:thiol-disulfide isomerase/thioredoxin
MRAVALLITAGCLQPLEESHEDTGDRTRYPGGGVSEGETIGNLEFVGPDGECFSFADIYSDADNKLLLLSTSAGWCSACIEEQPALEALHEQYRERGLFVMVSLFQYKNYSAADAALAKAWVDTYDLDLKVVADPEFVLSAYYDTSLTPMNMMVDLDTMTILKITTGWDPALVQSIIDAKL